MAKKKATKRKRNQSNFRILTEIGQIEDELEVIGQAELKSAIDEEKEYYYVEKILTFADIPGFGKFNYRKKDKTDKEAFSDEKMSFRADKNYLFYATKNDIIQYEKTNAKQKNFFVETHQSNISMPKSFYEFLGLVGTARNNKGLSLNSGKYQSFLTTSNLVNLFDKEITNETFEKLGRANKGKEVDIDFSKKLVQIDVHLAVHGIGTEKDAVFHNLRGNIFAKDRLCILVEKGPNCTYKLFYMFFRNPKFYELNNKLMPAYLMTYRTDEAEDTKKVESRTNQAKWRKELAERMLSSKSEDTDRVICPFTLIEVMYPAEATLLRASHIKAYAKCKIGDEINTAEAYDPENGFLVTANVDALFDKYLISVNPSDNTVVVSKTITNDLVFKKLGIQKRISDEYISAKKKDYLIQHYETFLDKEAKSKV